MRYLIWLQSGEGSFYQMTRSNMFAKVACAIIAAATLASGPVKATNVPPDVLSSIYNGAIFSFGATGTDAFTALFTIAGTNYTANNANNTGAISGVFSVETSGNGAHPGQFSYDSIVTTNNKQGANTIPGKTFKSIGTDITANSIQNNDIAHALNVVVSADGLAIDITDIYANAYNNTSIYIVLNTPLHFGVNLINTSLSYVCSGGTQTYSCVGNYDPHSNSTTGILTDNEIVSSSSSVQYFAAGSTLNVPEPASLALIGTGIVGLIGARRRRRQNG